MNLSNWAPDPTTPHLLLKVGGHSPTLDTHIRTVKDL